MINTTVAFIISASINSSPFALCVWHKGWCSSMDTRGRTQDLGPLSGVHHHDYLRSTHTHTHGLQNHRGRQLPLQMLSGFFVSQSLLDQIALKHTNSRLPLLSEGEETAVTNPISSPHLPNTALGAAGPAVGGLLLPGRKCSHLVVPIFVGAEVHQLSR